MRIFVDANVLFSAAHSPSGRAAALWELAGYGLCSLYASPHAVEESRRNLHIKDPRCLPRLTTLLGTVVLTNESTRDSVEWAIEQGLPMEDAPILGAAVEAKVDVIVTGDRCHFGHLFGKTLRGIRVITLAAPVSELLNL